MSRSPITTEYHLRIQHVQTYIQTHLDRPVDLAELARVAGFSPYHFHRIFVALVGEGVAEYVRRRRLLHAAHRILAGKDSITTIALDAHYETPAAFGKAFKQQFGIAPSRFVQLSTLEQARRLNRQPRRQKQRSFVMQPEIRELPEQRVLYVRRTGLVNGNFNQAASQAFDALHAYLKKHQAFGMLTESCLGICPDDPECTPAESCRYDVGYVLRPEAQPVLEDDAAIQVFPAGRWAVFTHRGPFETLGETWSAVYRDYLPASGLELRDHVPYEVYVDDPSRVAPQEMRTEIFIPIV